jgi:5-methyltetrahydropteroyltriglutamate--homocysteine methyltransferase
VESPADVEERIRVCLRYVPPERLTVSPDCGLSQTARWAARRKLESLVAGARRVREELELGPPGAGGRTARRT